MTTETNDKATTVAEQGAHVAPEKAASKKKGATRRKGAPKREKTAKRAKAKAARPLKAATESRSNKKAEVIAIMKRAKGVTLAEIMEATGRLERLRNAARRAKAA